MALDDPTAGNATADRPLVAPHHPSLDDISADNKVKILLAAYQKHAAELLAIEASQEKLINLVLGLYSAGLTLIAAMLKDARTLLQSPGHTVSYFGGALIAVALLIGGYAVYMSHKRNAARHAVRQGLSRVDQALAFFERGVYLQDSALYENNWLQYSKPGFLNLTHIIVLAAGAAFIAAVLFIGAG